MTFRLPLAVAGALFIAAPAFAAGKPDPRKYGWIESYSVGKAEAKLVPGLVEGAGRLASQSVPQLDHGALAFGEVLECSRDLFAVQPAIAELLPYACGKSWPVVEPVGQLRPPDRR